MCPRIARLRVQHPVGVGNVIGVEDTVLRFQCVTIGKIVVDEGRVDCAVDNAVSDMDAARAQLARDALRESA